MNNASDTVSFVSSQWLIIAFLAPMFWSLVNIIDVYFVDGVYKDELDGTIIFGIFQIIPSILLTFFINPNILAKLTDFRMGHFFINNSLLLAVLGGFLFTSAFFFYFKALFNQNDVALLQVLWNLSVIVIPTFTFIFLRERLPLLGYVGIAITLLGATLISFSERLKTKFSSKYISIMIGAVLLLSLSMIIEERVYSNLSSMGYGNHGFLIGFLFFSIGSFLGGVFFIFYGKRNPTALIKKYYKLFFLAEGLTFLGTLASQRAIDISPSVSYVAAVETFVPVFVLAFSLLIVLISKIIKTNKEMIRRIYNEQLDGVWVKIFATITMAVGVYLIS